MFKHTSRSVMERWTLLFSCTHFPSTRLAYLHSCSPHSPKLPRPPPETDRELAPFHHTREPGCMNSIKELSFGRGEAAPFPRDPKLIWSCSAFWVDKLVSECPFSVMDFSLEDRRASRRPVSSGTKPSVIQTCLNTDDGSDQQTISNSTEAVGNIWM